MNKSTIKKSHKNKFFMFIISLMLIFSSGCKQFLCVSATDLDNIPTINYKYGDYIICTIDKCRKQAFTLDTVLFDFYSQRMSEPINFDSLLSTTQKNSIDTFLVARKKLPSDAQHSIVSVEFVDYRGNRLTEMLEERKAYVELITENCVGLPITLDFGEKSANHIIYNQEILTSGKIINFMVFDDVEFIPIYISNEEITNKNHKYLLRPIPSFEEKKKSEEGE